MRIFAMQLDRVTQDLPFILHGHLEAILSRDAQCFVRTRKEQHVANQNGFVAFKPYATGWIGAFRNRTGGCWVPGWGSFWTCSRPKAWS